MCHLIDRYIEAKDIEKQFQNTCDFSLIERNERTETATSISTAVLLIVGAIKWL